MLWGERMVHHWLGNDAPAVVDDEGSVSGHELLRLAAGAAALLDDAGFRQGQAVPALMDETRTSIALVLGGALTGRPVAPLGTKLSVEDLTHAVAGLAANRLFVSSDRIELAERVASTLGVEITVLDAPAAPMEFTPRPASDDDPVSIVHTSGTTGHPKPILLRQRPLGVRVEVYQAAMGIGAGDRYCSASPFYHTAGVAMDLTVFGMGVSVVPQDWFSIDNWRRAGRLGVTCALLVPTMIDLLLAAGALGDASPKVLQYGAMPIHPDTLRAAVEVLPETRFLQIFGQTEVSPISYLDHEGHLEAVRHRPDRLLSVGRACAGTELRVENPDADGIGEIAVRAGHAFQIDADGWRRTGDLGVVDPDGFIFLHGRVNDRIIRGGENIYPLEIELALLGHPEVKDAAVVGVADRRWGEVVKAVVVTHAGSAPSEAELREFLAARLAHFKLPALIEFLDELPRNPSGKVLRRQLK